MKFQLLTLCSFLYSISGFNVADSIWRPSFSSSSFSSSSSSSHFIVGGDNAPDGQAPYQCSIQYFGNHFCGCSIVSNQWIVTAAHCLEWISDIELITSISILVGTNDISRGGVAYRVEKCKLHESFNNPQYAYDIGVLKVAGEIKFSDNVQPIALLPDEVPDGTELQLTGWGTLMVGGTTPKNLQIIKLNAVQTQRCRNIFAHDIIHDSHICTFTKLGQGACYGDSGGPLVLNNTLVGVLNFGVPCGAGYPDAYAKISFLYNWIKKQIA